MDRGHTSKSLLVTLGETLNFSVPYLLFSHSVMSDSLTPHGLQPARLLCPWDSPGKNTGKNCQFLLQRIFPDQGSNPCLQHRQVSPLPLSHQGSPAQCLNRWTTRDVPQFLLRKYILYANSSFITECNYFYKFKYFILPLLIFFL